MNPPNGIESRFKSWTSKSDDGCFHGPFHASDLISYMKCPQALKYKRVEGVSGSGEISASLLAGTAFHNAVELWHIANEGGMEFFGFDHRNLTLSNATEIIQACLGTAVGRELENGNETEKIQDAIVMDSAELFLKYTKHPLQEKEPVIGNEVSFSFAIDGLVFEGTIDRIRKNGECIVVEDLKTNGLKGHSFRYPSQEFLLNNLQFMVYVLAVSDRDTQWFYNNEPRERHDFSKYDICGLRYFMPTAMLVNRSGKNKGMPKGNPDVYAPFDKRRIQRYKETVTAIARLADAGNFFRAGVPGASGNNCDWCRYKERCTSLSEKKQLQRPAWLAEEMV